MQGPPRRAVSAGPQPHAGWRAACVVGLASGVGFGVSEGITYSADSYNGIAVGMTYLVRFASCVALHSIWAGAVAIVMNRNQDYTGGDGFDWGDAGNFILHYLLIAMVLHGLYDTLLKKATTSSGPCRWPSPASAGWPGWSGGSGAKIERRTFHGFAGSGGGTRT